MLFQLLLLVWGLYGCRRCGPPVWKSRGSGAVVVLGCPYTVVEAAIKSTYVNFIKLVEFTGR